MPQYDPISLKFLEFRLRRAEGSQAERLAQVHLTDLGVGKDFFRSSRRYDLPLVDYISAITDPECFTDLVVGDEHPDPATRELADDALDVENGERIDAREGLVEQHEARFHRERAGD